MSQKSFVIITKIIPYKEYDFFNIPIEVVKNNLRVPNDKYYGINFMNINNDKDHQRLEFRYIGGKDYESNIGQLTYFMDRFIINVFDFFIGEIAFKIPKFFVSASRAAVQK